jgi:hypothetical protein
MIANSPDQGPSRLPSLPIVTPDPPARSAREKYGTFFYASCIGLVGLVALLAWFGHRAWSMRGVWANVYILHDAARSDDDRIQAAFSLSHDPRVEQAQLWEMSLRRGLPDLARYLVAEGIGSDLVASDPQGYVSAVARSQDWTDWLRLVLARPLAYASTQGHAISRERLGELCRRSDPILRLWALYALAVQPRPDPQTVVEIEHAARSNGPEHELAEMLLAAVRAGETERLATLDRATLWNRDHQPDASRLWKGWVVRDGKLLRSPSLDGPEPPSGLPVGP